MIPGVERGRSGWGRLILRGEAAKVTIREQKGQSQCGRGAPQRDTHGQVGACFQGLCATLQWRGSDGPLSQAHV